MRKENSTFTLLKKALPNYFDLNSIQEIVSIASVEYNELSLREMKNAILNNELESFFENFKFNPLEDSIQLFLFINVDKTINACILFCPVGFYENEYIIEISKFKFSFDRNNFKELETIYKKNR